MPKSKLDKKKLKLKKKVHGPPKSLSSVDSHRDEARLKHLRKILPKGNFSVTQMSEGKPIKFKLTKMIKHKKFDPVISPAKKLKLRRSKRN